MEEAKDRKSSADLTEWEIWRAARPDCASPRLLALQPRQKQETKENLGGFIKQKQDKSN